MNFPDLLCRMALGEKPAAPRYRRGAKLRFLPLDVSAALSAWREPGRRWSYWAGFVRDLFDFGIKDGIFDPSDLRSSLAYLRSKASW